MRNFHRYTVIFFLFLFLLRSIEATLPYDHEDALYYHLGGARIWFEHSFSFLIGNLMSYGMAGIFDVFYYPLFFLNLGLVKTHSLAQFMHFFCSLGLASIFCIATARKTFWGVLGAIAILTIARDGSYFLYAKNDGVLAFIGLLATYSVVEKKSWVQVGFLLGLLPMIKISGLFVVIPLSLLYIFLNRHPAQIGKVAILSLSMLSLVLFKNYEISGNPMFPSFGHLFPGKMSAAMLQNMSGFFGTGFQWQNFIGLLSDLFLGKVMMILSLPLFIYNFKKKDHHTNIYFLVAISIFSLYLFSNGGYRAARFFFTCHFLLIYFVFLSFRKREFSVKWAWPLLALVLVDAKIDKSVKRAWTSLKDYRELSDESMIDKHIRYSAIWKKLPQSTSLNYIISDYAAANYYLPSNYVLHNPDHTVQASFLYFCDDVTKLSTYRYALVTKHLPDNRCFEKIRQGVLLIKSHEFELYQLF